METPGNAAGAPLPTDRLATFVAALDRIVGAGLAEDALLAQVGAEMRRLVAERSWLKPEAAAVIPERYAQRLLHRDPRGRFSVVCFVWDAGRETPVHDHGTWGVVGVLEGEELSQTYRLSAGSCVPWGDPVRIRQGEACLIPTADNIHQVRNGLPDRPSISIHAYGADIGRIERRVFDSAGNVRPFVSGYDPPAGD